MIGDLAKVQWLATAAELPKFSGVQYGFSASMDPLPAPVFHAKQVHDLNIIEVLPGAVPAEYIDVEADGLITGAANYCLAAKTADCLPVLMVDSGAKQIAAVHAGWRGFAKGVLAAAIARLEKHGAQVENLQVIIGPAISGANYEVGPEVLDSITAGAVDLGPSGLAGGVLKGTTDRWYLDLPALAAKSLCHAGLAAHNVYVWRHCTFNSAEFHSYRREGARMKSNYSWIHLT